MQLNNLFIIEPIAKAFMQEPFSVTVNSIHRDRFSTVYIYCQYFKGEEAPAPCRVCEEVVAIDRCHKACQVGALLNVLLVRHTVLHLRTGNKVLQFVFISLVEGFELVVNVDDEVLPDKAQHIFLLRIYLSCIAVVG